MAKEILVYKMVSNVDSIVYKDELNYTMVVWRPSLKKPVPPNKSVKYIVYSFFHAIGIFRNKFYSAYLLYDGKELVCSLLVVPAHFKWPFMGKKDIQFTYVMTVDKYKGRGLAGKLLEQVIFQMEKQVDAFWYVTDTENIASIKVAEKLGFKLIGRARRSGVTKQIKLLP
jgi:ribosomal protein S18 acetylase RimI-like enzyme